MYTVYILQCVHTPSKLKVEKKTCKIFLQNECVIHSLKYHNQ